MPHYRKDILQKPETIVLQPPYPVELLGLLLKCLLFKLIDEIYLFVQPHLTASKAFQVTAYAAVNLGFDLSQVIFNLLFSPENSTNRKLQVPPCITTPHKGFSSTGAILVL